jgi:hypothetical protein
VLQRARRDPTRRRAPAVARRTMRRLRCSRVERHVELWPPAVGCAPPQPRNPSPLLPTSMRRKPARLMLCYRCRGRR